MYVKITVEMEAHNNADAEQLMEINHGLYALFTSSPSLAFTLRAPGWEAAAALTTLRGPERRGSCAVLKQQLEAVGILRPMPLGQDSEDQRQLTELRIENEELKRQLAWERKQRDDEQKARAPKITRLWAVLGQVQDRKVRHHQLDEAADVIELLNEQQTKQAAELMQLRRLARRRHRTHRR